MGHGYELSRIETIAEKLGLLSERSTTTTKQRQGSSDRITPITENGRLTDYPDPADWHNWTEYESSGEPREYSLVPTACFNCEAGCGLLTYIDKETGEIRKIEGNPEHPGSRGKNCAKGPATINQLTDPQRILHPLKRDGPRGSGQWTQITWDEALSDIACRMRETIQNNCGNEITYHVGRPGHEDYMDRVIDAWGIDGHNSHTNICSAGARAGYGFWHKYDRPSADFANAEFILLLSAHLESGHYFNPHAQRIMEGMQDGGELAVLDPRLSNTAAMADYWLPTQPGSEAAVLLAMAKILIDEELYDREFIENWVNWRQFLDEEYPDRERTVDTYLRTIQEIYAEFTPEYVANESGVDSDTIETVARKIGRAGHRYASHIWRSAASGNKGGWQVARTLHFLSVLTGAVGTEGGTSPNAWHKFSPQLPNEPPRQRLWDELQLPPEYPFAHYEMSELLPYFLKENRGKLSVYFTRVFNPVYTYPDGFSWIEALTDEEKIGMHVALTPTWNETAYFADYVLPMGHSPERHDIQSQETHAGTWVTYRQPVLREYKEREGEDVAHTYDANPGEVWEEDEFWIELSWRIDEDGELGIREYFESPYRDGDDPVKMTVEEYYRYVFEQEAGLQKRAEAQGMTPLEYMKHYGAFQASTNEYALHETPLNPDILDEENVFVDQYGTIRRWLGGESEHPGSNDRSIFDKQTRSDRQTGLDGQAGSDRQNVSDEQTGTDKQIGLDDEAGTADDREYDYRAVTQTGGATTPETEVLGVMVDGEPKEGFPSPTGKQQFYSKTLADWGWDDERYTLPHYLKSHVHPENIDQENGEMVFVPTFRLPTQIHSRSSNSKYLEEISHNNPVWIHTNDAARLGVETGDLIRVETEIGYFVNEVWVTESIKPGLVAMSHHMGQWKVNREESDPDIEEGGDGFGKVTVDLDTQDSQWGMRQVSGISPFESSDPDSERIWWTDGGVAQNLTHAPHPDPISGMHCWHQKVMVKPAANDDYYGDVYVDTDRAFEIYREWLEETTPAPGPDGLRRPKWLKRPIAPPTELETDDAWYVGGPVGREERWDAESQSPGG